MLLSLEELSRDVEPGPTPSEIRRFEPDDFEAPSSEQSIAIVRGAKLSYVDVLAFWKAAEASVRLAVPARTEPLSKDAALTAIELRLHGLRSSFVFDLRSTFVAAQLMTIEWWYSSVLIETAREYIVFRWETSA